MVNSHLDVPEYSPPLRPIQSSALRLALGALHTSSVISQYAEAAKSLLARRSHTTANFLTTVTQFTHLSVLDHLFLPQKYLKYSHYNSK